MFISVFDIFKIGIVPSSSHTMGPMVAAARFLDELKKWEDRTPARLKARLYGSLAYTGKSHATDRAVILGLAGLTPDTLDPDDVDDLIARVAVEKRLRPAILPMSSIPKRTWSSTSANRFRAMPMA